MSRRTWIVFATTAAILSTSVATLSAEAARPLGTLPAEAATITDYYRQDNGLLPAECL
jgi:hypothetical protein